MIATKAFKLYTPDFQILNQFMYDFWGFETILARDMGDQKVESRPIDLDMDS